MTLYELSSMAGADVRLRRTDRGQWIADLERCESKESEDAACLVSTCGRGLAPDEALIALAKDLSGKFLVFRAYYTSRLEVQAQTITMEVP